jgi:hypothetical protein
MESKKINQLATNVAPQSTDLTIIGDPITGVSKKITWLQVSTLIGTAANLQQVTDNGATTTNPIAIGGLTITGLATGVLKSNSGVIASVPFGAANGVATLGGDGKVPSSQLPSYVDDVVEVANYAALPATGETGKIYITLDNNKVYRWTGSTYVEIAANNAVWGAITGTLSNQTDLQNALNTKLSSVGLSMPSGFSVSNSPLTANGTIAVTGAGNSTQYLDGTGALQTFPTLLSSDNLVKLVRNQSGATMTAGTVIYISGATGNKPLIAKALATGDSTSAQTYGIVQANIANNADGYIVIIGNVGDLDTSALTEGQQLYLSATTAGTYTTTKQYAPNHLVYVGIVLRSHPTQGIIGVKIQNGYEMDELHNVAAQSASNGDILQYVSSTSLWTKTAGTTTNIAEGTNLYYTEARVDANTNVAANTAARHNAVTIGTANGLSLSTQALSLALASTSTNGALSSTDWNTFNSKGGGSVTSVGLSSATSGVTIGSSPVTTSGTITLAIATASGSQNGLLSSTDWTTFNGKQDALNGTGFVKISGTTISYDNSTYLTTSSASSTYLPLAGGTLTGQLVINRASGNGLQVASDNVVITAATGFGSPRQLVFTCGNGPTTTLEAKGFGGNYITDFNIKTYNSSGTAFNVFFGTSAGDVGIGTDTPLSRLQVVATGTVLRLGEASGTTGKQLLFGVDSTTGRGEIQAVWQGTSNTPLGLNVAGGNVLIGTTTDNGAKLNVNGNIIATQGNFFQTASSGFGITLRNRNANQQWGLTVDVNAVDDKYLGLYDITNSAYRMVVTNGGNVGIGTSSPTAALDIDVAAGLMMRVKRTGVSGEFQMYQGTNVVYLDSAAASGNLAFATVGSERMRITSGGDVCVKTTTASFTASGRGNITIAGDSGSSAILGFKVGSVNRAYMFVNGEDTYLDNTSGTGLFIVLNGSGGVKLERNATSWTSNSDEKLKNINGNIESALDKILTLRAVNFSWKTDETNKENLGLIAQDVEKVFPQVVNKSKLAKSINSDNQDETEYLGIRYTELIPVLIAAIQELKAEIDELKNK